MIFNKFAKKISSLELDYLCTANLDGYFIDLTPNWTELLGYTIEELKAKPFISFTHPDDIDSTIKATQNLGDGNRVIDFVNRYITKNNEIIYLSWRSIYDPETKEIYAIAANITARIVATKKLEEQKLFYRNILHNMIEGYVVQDQTGAILQFNAAACDILGLSEDQLLGKKSVDKSWAAITADGSPFPGEDHPAMQVLKTGKAQREVVMGVRRPNGNYCWIAINSVPMKILSANGKEDLQALTTFRDITYDVHQKNIYKCINFIKSAFIRCDHNIETFCNEILNAITNVFHYPLIAITFPEKKDLSHNQCRRVYSKGISYENHPEKFKIQNPSFDNFENDLNYHLKNNLKENKSFHSPNNTSSMLLHPYIDHNEIQFTFIIFKNEGNFEDETNPKLNQIFDVIHELILRIKLENEVQMQKKISQHHSKLISIGELAAGVGHEINNPLTVIMGNTDMIKRLLTHEPIDIEKINEKIAKTEYASKRIRDITQGLRVFARADSQEFTDCSVNNAVMESVNMLKEIYSKDGVTLELDLSAGNTTIHGNFGRLQQMLVNLIANAKDATEGKDQRMIKVTTKDLKDRVQLVVEDNGSGIPEEIREKIFESFFTTKPVNKGTGIGLAMSYATIQDHKGQLELHSEMGVGTKFIITFKKA